MKKQIINVLLILLVLIWNYPAGAQILSLEDAVKTALEYNSKIKQYESKLKQSELENLSAWGNFLPSIAIEARYTHMDEKLQIDLNGIRSGIMSLQSSSQVELQNIYNVLNGLPQLDEAGRKMVFNSAYSALDKKLPMFNQTLKEQDYKTATLTAIQPIFLGGKILAAKKYAEVEKIAASTNLTKIRNEVTAEVIANYMQVLLLNKIVETRTDVYEGMKEHKRKAIKLFEQGLIANYHLYRAEVAVAEAERNLTKDINNLDLAKIALYEKLGLDYNPEISFSDAFTMKENLDSLDIYLEDARANQPLLQYIIQKKVSARQNYNVARSEFLPQVAAFGKYEMYPEYLSALEPRWAVGIQAKIKIFSGFKDYLNLQKAEELEHELECVNIEAENKIDLWVNKTYREVRNNINDYNQLAVTLKLADENLRMNEKRFDSGMGTSLEVIDARLSFEKAEVDRLIALYNYYFSLNELFLATGNPDKLICLWNQQEKK